MVGGYLGLAPGPQGRRCMRQLLALGPTGMHGRRPAVVEGGGTLLRGWMGGWGVGDGVRRAIHIIQRLGCVL